MPAVRGVAQPQHLRHGAGLRLRGLLAQPEQQEFAAPRRNADVKVLAQFELLGALQARGALLAQPQRLADADGDGRRKGYGRTSPEGDSAPGSARRPESSMSAKLSATCRGVSSPPGRYQV